MADETTQGAIKPEPPRGMYTGRLDDKGRLKVPADIAKYFNQLPEKMLFVTSLDRRIAQIYPMSVWRENEKFFETFRQNPKAARNVAFNANDLGGNAEMDSQGRLLVPPDLRRELGLENGTLHLYAYKSRIQILSDAVYQEQRKAASENAESDADLLEQAGLN